MSRNSHADADGYTYTDSDVYTDVDGYGDRDAHADGYEYINEHACSYSDAIVDADGDTNWNGGYVYVNTDGNVGDGGDRNIDADADEHIAASAADGNPDGDTAADGCRIGPAGESSVEADRCNRNWYCNDFAWKEAKD